MLCRQPGKGQLHSENWVPQSDAATTMNRIARRTGFEHEQDDRAIIGTQRSALPGKADYAKLARS